MSLMVLLILNMFKFLKTNLKLYHVFSDFWDIAGNWVHEVWVDGSVPWQKERKLQQICSGGKYLVLQKKNKTKQTYKEISRYIDCPKVHPIDFIYWNNQPQFFYLCSDGDWVELSRMNVRLTISHYGYVFSFRDVFKQSENLNNV